MTAPVIMFAISFIFGLHILFNLFTGKDTPIYSVIIHIFAFLAGFMVVNIPGDLYKGGFLTVTAILTWAALFIGAVFLFKDVLSPKRPSSYLGIIYILLIGAGTIFLLSYH
ncbi:MAG TPA: hypothetical protein VKD08_01655 [Ignavibacteriaceae bacterium]|jgi:hypothetical protein|nr:hypothetical protein [Ignavibacteriaceae bacterium]